MVRYIKRKTFKRRPTNWRRYRKPTNRTSGNSKVFSFKRTFCVQSMLINPFNGFIHCSNNNTSNGATGYYTLSALPNYTEFTNLFDQYKITGVKQKWIYSHNTESVPNVAQTTALPIFHSILDTNDGTTMAGTSPNMYAEHETHKMQRMDKPIARYFKVRPATALYATGAFNGYATSGNPWVDASTPSVQYYGIKWGIDPVTASPNANNATVQLFATYYIKCRGVK